MEVSNIRLSDVNRILMGDAPYSFLLEVVVRTLLVYFILLIVMRILGKRMSGQLTLTEMAVTIGLGAIISIPAQAQDRGILQGVLLLILVLAFQRGTTYLFFKNVRYEKMLQGDETMLVKDGIIQMHKLNAAKITREQLFAILRSQQIYHLGEVKRVYQEACGLFTVYKQEQPKPGISILPKPDEGVLSTQHRSEDGLEACGSCGNVEKTLLLKDKPHVCKFCGSEKWERAVI